MRLNAIFAIANVTIGLILENFGKFWSSIKINPHAPALTKDTANSRITQSTDVMCFDMDQKRHCVCVPIADTRYIHTFDDAKADTDHMTCDKLKQIIDTRQLEPDRKTRKLG